MTDPLLVCDKLWKLYGPDAAAIAAGGLDELSLEQIRAAGLIPAVRDATLAIIPGETFVIMGLSGSGKSTLVRCLSRLIEPTSGVLRFDGEDLRRMSARQMIELRRHKLGMVFQHFALLPHLSVLDNVAFPLRVQGVRRDRREARAREVIELVGLAGREAHLPRQLSGGQQQRVGIARSLAVEPELWFLDEPFSALDPLIRREMQDEFIRLQERLKKTIVFITHDFDEAIRLADRIAIMKDGAIIQVDTPESLVLRPHDGYVAEFTRHVPRDKVISVGSIMQGVVNSANQVKQTEPAPGSQPLKLVVDSTASGIPATALVASVARQVLEASTALPVIDERGQQVGAIDRDAVLSVLVDRPV